MALLSNHNKILCTKLQYHAAEKSTVDSSQNKTPACITYKIKYYFIFIINITSGANNNNSQYKKGENKIPFFLVDETFYIITNT